MYVFKSIFLSSMMALAIFNTGCLSPQTSGSTGSAESGGGRSIASISPNPSPTPFPTPTPSGTVTNPSPIGSDSEIGSLGFNGEGMTQNYALLTSAQKDQLAQWLKDLGRPVTFRIPGGGSSRFHHPNVATPGWGSRKQEIVWYFDCFAPSDDSAANKSSELQGVDSTDSVAPQSYLNEIVDLSERMDGNLRIIYVANVMIYPSNLASIGTSTSIANCAS